MASITYRLSSSGPLTNSQVDDNFRQLNLEKIERDGSIAMTAKLPLALSTTAGASLLVPPGAAPTSPVAGDVWNVAGALKFYTGTATALVLTDQTADITLFDNLTVPGDMSVGGQMDIAVGESYRINDVPVLSSTALGAGVVSSSLTSVGILTNLRTTSLGVGMAASGTAGRIDATGEVVAYSSSDERLKMDIQIIPDALESVLGLRGVLFNWNPEFKLAHGFEGADTGVIAQEVIEVLPEVVTMRENGYLAVKYEKMIGLLIEAIKELNEKVETCKCTCNKS